MDKIESLGNTISNITLYDIKSMYTQVRVMSTTRQLERDYPHPSGRNHSIGEECCIQRQRDGGKSAGSYE
jgi:hypothetical protein